MKALLGSSQFHQRSSQMPHIGSPPHLKIPQGPHQLECSILSRCPQNLRPVFQLTPKNNKDFDENGNLEVCNEEIMEPGEHGSKEEKNSESNLAKEKLSSCPSMGVILPLRLAIIARRDTRLSLLMDHRFAVKLAHF